VPNFIFYIFEQLQYLKIANVKKCVAFESSQRRSYSWAYPDWY